MLYVDTMFSSSSLREKERGDEHGERSEPPERSEGISEADLISKADLRRRGAFVVSAVADNASNFQGIQLPECLLLRCLAHGIQLVVKDVIPLFEAEVAFARSVEKKYGLPSPCETRWNSTYRMLCALQQKKSQVEETEQIIRNEVAIELLKPATSFKVTKHPSLMHFTVSNSFLMLLQSKRLSVVLFEVPFQDVQSNCFQSQ